MYNSDFMFSLLYRLFHHVIFTRLVIMWDITSLIIKHSFQTNRLLLLRETVVQRYSFLILNCLPPKIFIV